MSNLDNIIQKIMTEAQTTVAVIDKEAERDVADIVKKRVDYANSLKSKLLEKTQIEAEQIKEKVISNATLKSRDDILLAKQNVLDRVFDLAKKKLKTLDEKTYLTFLKNSLSYLKLSSDSVLVVPENMKASVKQANLGYAIADETIESGFAAKTGKVVFNNSFDNLVDSIREELEGEIVTKLFKE